MFQHLANGLNTAIDGANIPFPFPIKILARIFRGLVINRRMRPGVKLPPKAAMLLLPGDTATQAGLAELLKSLDRWQTETTRHPHFAFGKLSPQQWEKLQLRHAEMHLSLAVPRATQS